MMRRIAVLGGAGGIGRALVSSLLARGDEVVVLDLTSSLEKHAPETMMIPIDISSEQSVDDAFVHLAANRPALDGFVNLSGYNSRIEPLSGMSADYFDDIITGNLRGTFLTARAALPLMAEGGRMVMVASGLAQFVRPGYGPYSASKAGIIALAKTLAQECAPRIRVNAVGPGLVDTAFLRGGTGRCDERGQSAVNFDAYVKAIPLGRLAYPKDVVGPIEFLLDEASAYMTGQVLWVNGGAYMP